MSLAKGNPNVLEKPAPVIVQLQGANDETYKETGSYPAAREVLKNSIGNYFTTYTAELVNQLPPISQELRTFCKVLTLNNIFFCFSYSFQN